MARDESVRLTNATEIEEALIDCWVVILLDPDAGDWSPWSVIAKDKPRAIAQARRDWRTDRL